MKIQLYNTSLIYLKKEHIELVRYWRNHPKISEKMEYREYITEEMQVKWFNSINIPGSYLNVIVSVNNNYIGLVTSKFNDKYSEGGAFYWDEKYLNSEIPVVVSVIMSDLNFYFLQKNETYIKILKTNTNAIIYNSKLGYKLEDNQTEFSNQLYKLTKEDYEINVEKYRKMLSRIYSKENEKIKIVFEKEDIYTGNLAYMKSVIDINYNFYQYFTLEYSNFI